MSTSSGLFGCLGEVCGTLCGGKDGAGGVFLAVDSSARARLQNGEAEDAGGLSLRSALGKLRPGQFRSAVSQEVHSLRENEKLNDHVETLTLAMMKKKILYL